MTDMLLKDENTDSGGWTELGKITELVNVRPELCSQASGFTPPAACCSYFPW